MATPDDDLAICCACGTQYEQPLASNSLKRCKICDDPRQFVPSEGQKWTSLREIRQHHKNTFYEHEYDLWHIVTEPRFGIGQRAFLIKSMEGNILWDCVALLDDETISFINSHGRLRAIVISHPHFYTTGAVWAKTFKCKVYTSFEDREWCCRDPAQFVSFLRMPVEYITQETVAIKLGGHFDGSLVLVWGDHLFVADTIMTVPAAYTPHPRPPGQHTFAFMWSIPNMIPLSADIVFDMWKRIKTHNFRITHGGFVGMDVEEETNEAMKKRVLESMQMQVRSMGWPQHELLRETI